MNVSTILCFPSTFVRIVYFQRQTSGISSIIPRAIVAYSSCLFEFLICIANLVFLPMTSQTSKLCRQSMRMNLPNGSQVFPFYSCFPSNRCKFSASFAALHKVLSKEVEACRTGKCWLEFQKTLCYNTPTSETSLQHDEK